MIWLMVLGIVIFMAVHVVPSRAAWKASLQQRFGANGYKGLFSLTAAVGLILIIVGKAYAAFIPLWEPPAWTRMVAVVMMLPVFILLVTAERSSNIRRLTAHPMLWGVGLWAFVHLLANGDLASLMLFGSFGAYAVWNTHSLNARGAATITEAIPVSKDLVSVAIGAAAYFAVLWLHPYLFKVAVVAF